MNSSSVIGLGTIGAAIWGFGKAIEVLKIYRQNYRTPYMCIDSLNMYPIAKMRICFTNYQIFKDVLFSGEANFICRTIADYIISWWDKFWFIAESLFLLSIESADRTMVTWDKFDEYVMPSVQGCPVSMVHSAVRSACIEFCEKSLIWKQDSIKNDILAGWDTYSFAPPPNAKVVMPYRMTIKTEDMPTGIEIEQVALSELESFLPKWQDAQSRIPKFYVLIADDTVRFIGTPTEDMPECLVAGVALKPTRNAKHCPTFIYSDWAETIAAGALARLHAMKQKDWAIPELVSYYQRNFKEGISRAKSKSDKSWLRESKNMLPVKFYNGKGYF